MDLQLKLDAFKFYCERSYIYAQPNKAFNEIILVQAFY